MGLKKCETNLICHGDKDRAQKQISAQCVLLLNLSVGPGEKVPRQLAQKRQRHHKVVPVSLDKVVPRDGRRIDVVLPERSQKILKANLNYFA